MSSSPNPKAFMYLALGTVTIGGALCYYQFSKLSEVEVRVAKLKTQVSDPVAVQQHLDESNVKLEGAKQVLTHLEANVSSASYVPSLLRDLDTYGKVNGIEVTGVRPAPKKPGDDEAKAKSGKPYDELIIQVTGTGPFKSIENFVANLPKFPKIVAARMVSIEPARSAGTNEPAGALSMTVELKAYIFKDGTQPPVALTGTSAATPPAGTVNQVPLRPTVPSTPKPAAATGKTAFRSAKEGAI